jgi:hypothetical protein
LAAFYRYWKSSITDHFYTTNISEIGTSSPGAVGHHGYTSEGFQCFVYSRQVAGTVPLYRYWKSSIGDHFYTTNTNAIGTTTPGATGRYGYTSEGIAGYCFPRTSAGRVPLYRYWSGSDHFYTTNPREIGTIIGGQVGNHGYRSEGVACYVIPKEQSNTGLIEFNRYWKSSITDHFYTTNINEIGTLNPGLVGHHGYTSEGFQCFVYSRQVAGTVPLYRYWKSSIGDHFYTTNTNAIGTTTPGATGRYGYTSEGIAGYCFPRNSAGRVPLYRYWSGSDHLYTTNSREIGTTTPGRTGNHGYVFEGVACYVISA